MYSYSTFHLSFVFSRIDLRSVAVGSQVTRDAVRLSMPTVRPLKGQPARPHSSATPTIAFVHKTCAPNLNRVRRVTFMSAWHIYQHELEN